MKKICTSLLIAISVYSNAQSVLNTKLNEIHFGASSSPLYLIKLNNTIIFSAERNGDEGRELWSYNSENQKSILLKDIFPGHNSGMSDQPFFSKIGNKVYFFAKENFTYNQIWVTDGTSSGTQKLKDLNSNYEVLGKAVGSKLFFYINKELWVYDTISNDLILLKTFEYTSGSINMYEFNNQLFLAANDGISGKEIWKSDGTVVGTNLLKDIALNSGSSISNDFKILTLNNGKFYFIANTSTGYQLYESDGTTAGTVSIKPIQGIGELNGASAGNYFVFSGFDPAGGGFEPWISDGTAIGTKILKDIYPGNTSSMGISKFFKLNNKIYFESSSNGINPAYGNYIWETDGTEAGTILFNTPTNNVLYGTSSDEQHLILMKPNEGSRFWIANGNPTQTFEITGLGMPYNNSFIDLNSKIYLAGSNVKQGMELFSLNPTSHETTLATDISRYESASPHSYDLLNNNLIFIAADREFNNQIYKRDKTTQQISRLTNFTSGSSSTGMFTNFDDPFIKVGNYLYTRNSSPNFRSVFYRTDGSTSNSVMIPTPDTKTNDVAMHVNLNDNSLLFAGYNNIMGTELWKIDNNSNAPVLVKDISTDNMGSMYNTDPKAVVVNGNAYFVAKENGKLGIWKSDGTPANTSKAIQFSFQDGADGDIKIFGSFNNKLLFTTRKENSSNLGNTELFISNGDQTTSVLLKSHNVAFGSGNINRDTEVLNNKLYYIVTGYPGGVYSTDGTVVGTVEVLSGNFFGDIKLKKCGNQLFFTNNNATQLWKSDGTNVGTQNLSSNFTSIKDMVCNGNYLYFLNGESQKVWRSDGTASNTMPLDILVTNDDNQLLTNENILKLASDNDKLYFTVFTKEHGEEFYEVTTPMPIFLAIKETEAKNINTVTNIQVYPNPVTDFFSVKTKGNEKIETIRIFDTSGKLIKTITFNNDRMNIADLSSGIYFLKIKTNKGDFFSKILKK